MDYFWIHVSKKGLDPDPKNSTSYPYHIHTKYFHTYIDIQEGFIKRGEVKMNNMQCTYCVHVQDI